MPSYTCPNGHNCEQAVVCGGSGPYFAHGADPEEDEGRTGNIYFLMDIPSGKLTRKLFSPVDFVLTDEDWADMHDHAEGGCAAEPQCLVCLEYLEER